MQTRTIPSTGAHLPVIGCGTWLGFDVSSQPGALPERAAVLDALFEAGGTLVDTSPMYGSAEPVIGDLLYQSVSRSKAFIASKVWTTGERAGRAQVAQSMRLLRTDRIDLLQVHNLVDWRVQLGTLRALKDDGLISYIGVTHYNESGYAELEDIMRSQPLDFVQFNYSMGNRAAEKRLLPLAADRGIAVIGNRPFGGGIELRKLRNTPLPEWAAEIRCTSWSEVMLKFVLSHPAITCVVPGTGNSAHMRENATAGSGLLPRREFWTLRLADQMTF